MTDESETVGHVVRRVMAARPGQARPLTNYTLLTGDHLLVLGSRETHNIIKTSRDSKLHIGLFGFLAYGILLKLRVKLMFPNDSQILVDDFRHQNFGIWTFLG